MFRNEMWSWAVRITGLEHRNYEREVLLPDHYQGGGWVWVWFPEVGEVCSMAVSLSGEITF